MSYLSDEPLSHEEEKAVLRAERQYIYQNRRLPPKSIDNLPVPITANHSRADYSIHEYMQLKSDYFKITIPPSSPNCFQINSNTYEHLLRLIKRRYGHYPRNGTLICDTITIMPIPNQRCCLYYRIGENDADEPGQYQLISSFVADRYTRKMSVSCPYSDSFVGDRKCIFNWFGNDKTGRIVPKTISTNLTLPALNGHMPWLTSKPFGSFFLYGVCDAIGFHCSFIGEPNWQPKKLHRYHTAKHYLRKEHIPSQKISLDGDIGYEIPSQDIEYDPNAPDPLIEAFSK